MRVSKNTRVLTIMLAVCGLFLASCGGGSGGSSASTINGISVPPEPDIKQNNATIAGIDSNSNGVRDDVERKVAEKSKDSEEYLRALNYAIIIQDIVTNNKIYSESDLICASLAHPEGEEVAEKIITDLVVNNEARLSAYKDAILMKNGMLIKTTTELNDIKEQCK
jgi:hypothetical protein